MFHAKQMLAVILFGVIYTADEEEHFNSERSAHERSLSGTRVSVSAITDEASHYYQDT